MPRTWNLRSFPPPALAWGQYRAAIWHLQGGRDPAVDGAIGMRRSPDSSRQGSERLLPDDFQLIVDLLDPAQFSQRFCGHLLLKERTHLAADHNVPFPGFALDRIPSQVGIVLKCPLCLVF